MTKNSIPQNKSAPKPKPGNLLQRTIVRPVANWFVMFWDGFTSMSTLGKTLWIVVTVKLIIMFGILKPFFFPRFLNSKEDKPSYVREELVDRAATTTLPVGE